MEHQQQQELLLPVIPAAQVTGLACLMTNGQHNDNKGKLGKTAHLIFFLFFAVTCLKYYFFCHF
jgi:hypothetical protein